MTKNSKLASAVVILVGLIALVLASSAIARPNDAGQRGGRERGKPLFGEVLSIDGDSITIAPKIPDFIAEKMAERGIEPPTDMPSEVVVTLNDKTKWFADSEKTDAASFAEGDLVAIVVKPNNYGELTALKVSDEATAKQFMKQQMEQRGGNQKNSQRQGAQQGKGKQGQRQGAHQGQGKHGQRSGQGNDRQRERPAFGEIIAIDSGSITIAPEVPAFIQAKMDERGGGRDIELPEELTFTLGEKTHFVVDGEPSEENPFSVGDKVAVIGGIGDERPAMAVADYATVEAKMAERGGTGQRGDQGQGKGPKGKRGKQGKGSQEKGPRGKR